MTDLPPALQTSGIVIAALTLFGLVIRMVGPWRRQIDDLETKLRAELRADRAKCERDLGVVKHRERRTRQLLYSTLRLFDQPAARRKPMLDRIYEELATIEQAEALESGIVSTAGIREAAE